MKKSTTWRSLAALLLAPLGFAYAGEDCLLGKESIRLDIGSDIAGKTGMVQCRDSDSKQLTREQEIRNGALVGRLRFYTDGKLKLEYAVDERGQHHGVLRRFNDKAQLLQEETEEHGTPQGFQREWFDNGLIKRVEFIGAQRKQKAAVRFTPKGQLNSVECGPEPMLAPHADDALLCGFKNGPHTVDLFEDEGGLRVREVWQSGKLKKASRFYKDPKQLRSVTEMKDEQRTETEFSEAGQKTQEEVWSESVRPAVLLRRSTFSEGGQLTHLQTFDMLQWAGRKRHLPVSDDTYYLNGQPKSKELYSIQGEERFKEIQSFSDTGKLSSKGSYLLDGPYRERPVGVHQGFTNKGNLSSESHYNDKGRVVRYKAWDVQGALQSDEQVFEDGSRKAFAK